MKIAYLRMTLLALAITVLPMACGVLGVPPAKTFNEKWLAAQTADTTILQTEVALLQAGKISKEDGKNIEAQADNVKAGLDVARTIYETDEAGGTSKLDSVVTALTALQTYLATKEPK